MRYYLDTNILVFLITEQRNEISPDVQALISDYGNIMLTSTACVQELIHLYQIGKLPFRRRSHQPDASQIISWIDDAGIDIVPICRAHLQCYASLPLYDDHRDPNDRLIIAQAIADRLPLVSSDRKFTRYARHGLHFIYNER